MTIEDTLATVDPVAVAAVFNSTLFNSTLFNALARLKAGLSDSGWRQFNRQFVEIVPFPRTVVENSGVVDRLAALAGRIAELQEHARRATTEGARDALHATLDVVWADLDLAVEEVYGLDASQREVSHPYPRIVDRFQLLLRQAAPPEEEE